MMKLPQSPCVLVHVYVMRIVGCTLYCGLWVYDLSAGHSSEGRMVACNHPRELQL
jgi:hypothetical protein